MNESDVITAQSHLTLEERIRRRAHQIWLSRKAAGEPDDALANWLRAEREVLGDDPHSSPQNRGTTVGSAYAPGFIPQEES
jgi:hypothetical protein